MTTARSSRSTVHLAICGVSLPHCGLRNPSLWIALGWVSLVLVTASPAFASPNSLARERAVVAADVTKIRAAEQTGSPMGPTSKLLTDLRALHTLVEAPASGLSTTQRATVLFQTLGIATTVGARSFTARAAIYHALGYKVVG